MARESTDAAVPLLTARQEQGRRSRDRILDAAEQLIVRHGYAATSISMIAKSSGLPASSLYWHFNSKEDLLAAVVDRAARRWVHTRPSWESFGDDLSGFLQSLASGIDAQAHFPALMMQLLLEGPETAPSAAREMIRDLWLSARAGLEPLTAYHFGLGGSPADRALARRLTAFMMSIFDGLVIAARADPKTKVTEVLADLATALEAIATAHRSSRRKS